MKKNEILRQLPAVDEVLEWEEIADISDKYNKTWVKKAVQDTIDEMRADLLQILERQDAERARKKALEMTARDKVLAGIKSLLRSKDRPLLAPAVNATGVIVHTNLGRSLLSSRARDMVEQVSAHYSTLEIDRESGERGSRYDNVSGLLCELTGAEDAFVVNNNAAAVLLALSTFARGSEVIISRGELVEIGGSFRIPDVMKQGGAELVEVGTTNKVYAGDYEEAIGEDTALLLKVHTSNYRIMGFTADVSVQELKELGREYGLPVLDDLGSGVMFDMRQFGLEYEPTLRERVEAGGDIITCSGDKILGGPQAGIVLGRKEYVEKMKNNPLTRAIRVDKMTLAALEGTLKSYYDMDQALEEIPTLQMIDSSLEKLKKRAENLKEAIAAASGELEGYLELEKGISRVGGGSYPVSELPTWTLTLSTGGDPEPLARELRRDYPPIFCRISEGKLIFDVRTLVEGDIDRISAACADLEV